MDSAVTKDSKVSQTAGGLGWGQRGLGPVLAWCWVGWVPSIRMWGRGGPGLVSTCWWVTPNPGVSSCPVEGWSQALGSRAAGFKVPELMFSAPGGQSWGLGVSRAGAYPLVGEAGPRASASPLPGRDSPRVFCCRHGGFRAQ